jgi:hypothetical protein
MRFADLKRMVLADVPSVCCGCRPPEFALCETGQLLHLFCRHCAGYFTTYPRWYLMEQGGTPATLLSVDGISHTLDEWATITGIPRITILFRLRRGWSVRRAVLGSAVASRKKEPSPTPI